MTALSQPGTPPPHRPAVTTGAITRASTSAGIATHTAAPAAPGQATRRMAAMMVGSGFAGLAWQIVWTEQLGSWLGHEQVAVLAVVTAFFGGLALGAWALGRRIAASARPSRWYAACEAVVGGWGALLALGLPWAGAWLTRWIGPEPSTLWHWTLAFAGPALLLLPATAAMGATLPAADGLLRQLHARHRSVALLYAANTAGAVLGVLAAAFVLVPAWGLARTAWACALINLACGALALGRWAQARPAAEAGVQADAATRATLGAAAMASAVPAAPGAAAPGWASRSGNSAARTPAQRRLLGLATATGTLGIGYEVVVVRVLSQVAEDTVYTFALLLAVYLLGTAAGAAAWAAWRRRRPDSAPAGRLGLPGWLLGLGLACLLGSGALTQSARLVAWLLAAGDGGAGAALSAEAGAALLVFGLPTAVMGALFSVLAALAEREGLALGRLLAANTLGGALGPPLVGVLGVTLLGPQATLLGLSAAYLGAAWWAGRALPGPGAAGPGPGHGLATGWLAAGVAALGLAALALPPLRFVSLPEGGRLLRNSDGPRAAVSVTEDADGVRRLRIDNRAQEGSSATVLADARGAWLPLLLHPAPHDALLLGLGTGATARAAAEAPGLRVQAVELLAEVRDSAADFAAGWQQATGEPGALPPVTVADARRFVRAGGPRYDVVIADLFHPARSGAGALFTVEHFAAIRARLQPGGLFCQWLPLHQLDLASLRSIVAAYLAVYPDAVLVLASHSLDTPVLGLLSRPDAPRLALPALQQRLSDLLGSSPPAQAATGPGAAAGAGNPPGPSTARLRQLQLDRPLAVAGTLLAGPVALARWAHGATPNSDDRPVVAHLAPWATYAPEASPRERLLAVLRALQPRPADLLAPPADAHDQALQQRLVAYWQARSAFIEAGIAVRPVADPAAMLDQVQAPLLAIVRTSADFRPAYDPLLHLARALWPRDQVRGRQLLLALADANPQRPDALRLLQALSAP